MESPEAKRNIAEAHTLLAGLRERLLQVEQQHPELEQAIERLEAALSALTVQTGGML
ncbi:MAG: hypothetical protein JOZ43_03090 [Acidobacteriales bacterium]|nr:hypothetical protein [Terriglobales bacterium]